MSSLPGYTLESFVAWNHDVVSEGEPDANWSLSAAEAVGTIAARPRISSATFAKAVAMYEPYREQIEQLLADFDEETQSWRDYAGASFFIPHTVYEEAGRILQP